MIGISLRFLSGRYHATPWGRHVNEGAVEWPPSPWRLLRAIVATWKRTLPDIPESEAESVLRSLAKPPEFVLPPASTGHTRHFMPWFKKGLDDRTLVFDTFVVVDPSAEVTFIWAQADMRDGHREALARILGNMSFFGRAESWCEARLLDETDAARLSNRANCCLLRDDTKSNDEIVRVLCADPAGAFSDEHVVELKTIVEGRGKNKTTTKQRRPVYDPSWHLCMETLRLHEQKWSDPPGSKWVRYRRSVDCFEVRSRLTPVCPHKLKPQVVRFALDSTVLPLLTETLPVAESARRMLMGIYGRMFRQSDGSKGRSQTLSGKNAEGVVIPGHKHAYYLPTDEDGDGRLDHLTVVASDGFTAEEWRAFDRLRELKSADRKHTGHTLRVLLLGLGRLDDYQSMPIQPSSIWVSVTPFIATRYLKKRGTKRDPIELWGDSVRFIQAVLGEEISRLLQRRQDLHNISLEQIKIQPLIDEHGVFRICGRNNVSHELRPIQFKRFRQKSSDDGGRRTTGAFRLVFPSPVSGPICLGHSAHFGMGLFLPVREE